MCGLSPLHSGPDALPARITRFVTVILSAILPPLNTLITCSFWFDVALNSQTEQPLATLNALKAIMGELVMISFNVMIQT